MEQSKSNENLKKGSKNLEKNCKIRSKRRMFFKISDQMYETMLNDNEFLEREKVPKSSVVIDNNENLYFTNKLPLNRLNYIKTFYNNKKIN